MDLKWRLSQARGYVGLGMIEEAAAELDHVPADASEQVDVLALRAVVLQEQKKWPALAGIARALVARRPEEVGWWIILAYATRRSESLAAAEGILREAERSHPEDPTLHFNLGCYACVRGDLAEARRRVERAIRLDPSFRKARATDPDLSALRSADGESQPDTPVAT